MPGTLVFTGDQKVSIPEVHCIQYNESELREFDLTDDLKIPSAPQTITWINVNGIHEVALIEKLGAHYKLHPLTLEDIVHPDQRPKREDMGEYLFLVLKMLTFCEADNGEPRSVIAEQVSIVLGKDFVISFQEDKQKGDVFDHVRERLRTNKGKIRRSGSDYLGYTLIDSIVDYYFLILEHAGETVEEVEQALMENPQRQFLDSIYHLKRLMLTLRRNVWPVREMLNLLGRDESPILHQSTNVYLQDVYSHTVQIIDQVEVLRETVSTMLEIYLSSVSYKLNATMKFLTLVATIFMPLTFIAGVYGMNFEHMPELRWRYGYPGSLILMLLVALAMVVFFHHKKWIGEK